MKALIQDKPLPEPTPGRVQEQAEQQPHTSQAGLAKCWRWYNHAAFSRDLPVNERVLVFLKEEVQNQGSRRGWSEKVAKRFWGLKCLDE